MNAFTSLRVDRFFTTFTALCIHSFPRKLLFSAVLAIWTISTFSNFLKRQFLAKGCDNLPQRTLARNPISKLAVCYFSGFQEADNMPFDAKRYVATQTSNTWAEYASSSCLSHLSGMNKDRAPS